MITRSRVMDRPVTFGEWINQIRNTRLKPSDWICLSFIALGIIYYSITAPLVTCVILMFSAGTICIHLLFLAVPQLSQSWGLKLKPWHVISLLMAVVMVASVFELPSHAAMFSAIEAEVTNLINNSGTALDPNFVSSIFGFLRVLVILGLIIGIFFVINTAMQGQQWQPIASMVGIGFGVILGIEVLSQIVLN